MYNYNQVVVLYLLGGRALTRLFVERNIWSSNLGPVISDRVAKDLPPLQGFFKGSCVAQRNDEEMAAQTRCTFERK